MKKSDTAKAHKQVRHEDSEAILCFRLNTKRMFMIHLQGKHYSIRRCNVNWWNAVAALGIDPLRGSTLRLLIMPLRYEPPRA